MRKILNILINCYEKKILILGASSDIGISTSIKFLENGWHVVAHCNKNTKILLNLKKKFKNKLTILKIDLNNINKISKIIRSNKKKLSEINSFVSLVGYLKKSEYQNINYKLLINHFNINFFLILFSLTF